MKNYILCVALISLNMILSNVTYAENSPCKINDGFQLINQPDPSLSEIKKILVDCDKALPDNAQVLLLHGLLARKEGLPRKDFTKAIDWLQKARLHAASNYTIPALELAVTYEWSGQPEKA